MKEITVETKIGFYDTVEDLSIEDQKLLEQAHLAIGKSHSPYSGFSVGASVILRNGEVLSGANQENAAYPMCLCAEMVVLSTVSSRYPGEEIKAMAITIRSKKRVVDTPVSPCGACRQTLLEFENRQEGKIRILLQGEIGPVYEVQSVKQLLPLSFDDSLL